MSRAHNVVNKLQGLIDKSNDCTKKHDTNLHGAIDSLIEGFGKGEGGSGIIDVIELPTENIDENAVYRTTEIVVSEPEVYVNVTRHPAYPEGKIFTITEFFIEIGMPAGATISITQVAVLPDIMEPLSNMVLPLYVLESDGKVYITETGSPADAFTLGEMLDGIPEYGFVDDITEATEEGIYCVRSKNYSKYHYWMYKDGAWVEGFEKDEGGIIDVTELPTENIDDNKIYRTTKETGPSVEIYGVWNSSPVMTLSELFSALEDFPPVDNFIIHMIDSPADFNPDTIIPYGASGLDLHVYVDTESGAAYVDMGTGNGVQDLMLDVIVFYPEENYGVISNLNDLAGANYAYGYLLTEGKIHTIYGIPDKENTKTTFEYTADGEWVELISKEHMPIIKPLTITKNGVYEATEGGSLEYDTEVKFKDTITEADFKAYIANAELMNNDGERNFYALANAMAVVQWQISDSLSVYMIMDQQSGIGYMLNGAIMDEGMSDGWQSMSSGEPIDAPVITIPSDADMSADLATTAVFFDIEEKVDAYCPIIVDVAASAPPALGRLNITKNGTYTAETVAPGGEYVFKDNYTEDELKTLSDNGAPDWEAESTYINSSSRLIDANFNLSIRTINNVHFIEYYAYDDSFGFVYATEEAAASGEIEQITEPGWFDRNDMVKVDTPSIAFPSDTHFIVDLYMLTSMFKPTDGWNEVTVAVWPVLQNITIRKNGVYNHPMDVYGFSTVTVDVEPTVSKITITKNGVYTPSEDIDGYSEIVVDVIGGGEADKYFEGGHTSIVLPTATKIKDYAFQDDTALQNIEMPNVTDIGKYVFDGCSNLSAIEMPSVTHIGRYAFYQCNNLALTELPSGLTKIDSNAFDQCKKLTLTELPNGLTNIGSSAFRECSNLALTELPSGVTSIESSVFSNCSNLALTKLPDGLTSIGAFAFSKCNHLALTELPSGITSIGSSAFQSCNQLALTELPSGITSIDSSAFQNCIGLTTLTFKGTPTSIGNNAFRYCTRLATINVPWAEGAVSGAPWGAPNATINYNYTGDAAE